MMVRHVLSDVFGVYDDPVENARRARTVRYCAVVIAGLGLVCSVTFAWGGWDELLLISELVMVAAVASFVLVRNPRHATLAAHLVIAAPFLALVSAATLAGGLGSSPLLVATAFPAIATLLISPRAGLAWLVAGGGVALTFTAWGTVPVAASPELVEQLDITLLFTMPVVLYLMAVTWEHGRRDGWPPTTPPRRRGSRPKPTSRSCAPIGCPPRVSSRRAWPTRSTTRSPTSGSTASSSSGSPSARRKSTCRTPSSGVSPAR